MKHLTAYIIAGLILAGCGPQAKLKRAERLIKKAELQGAQWKYDTVYKDTTIFITGTRVDSIFSFRPGDSVVIWKDRLKVIVKRIKADTIRIDAACLPDTVKIQVPVKVEKVIYAPEKGLKTWQWIIIALAAGLIVGIIIKR